MARTVELDSHLEQAVTSLVRSGRFSSDREVLREGVRLIEERDARLAELDRAIERGVSDVEAGNVKPLDEVFDRLEAKYRALAHAKKE
jgi:antitoxin ParD1/3/4